MKDFIKSVPYIVVGAFLAEADWPVVLRVGQGGATVAGTAYTETEAEVWYLLATTLNTARLEITKVLISALGSSVSIQTIQSINSWGNQFTDPVKVIKQIEQLYKLYDNTEKMLQ